MSTNKERIEISVSPRAIGKHESRQSRLQGRIPAVIYGPKMEAINVTTDELSLKKYSNSKYESTIFNLKSDDGKLNKVSVIIRDVQVHPTTRRPVHADLYAPDMTKPVRVHVAIRIEGKAQGLAEGGLLEHMLRDIEIDVLPLEIPEFVVLDVTNLGLGEALHVSDLKIPAGVKVVSLPTLTVATVAVPKEEAAPTPVAAAADAAAPAAGAAAAPGAAPAAGAAAPAAAAPAKK
jgi:large subunit ribosomal protein L25